MWEKIKKWFGFLDLNKDGKVTAEDLEVARAIADKKAKEDAEVINQADSLIFQIEKTMKDMEGNLSEEEKTEATNSIEELKSAHSTKNVEDIKSKMETVNSVFQKISEKMYSQSQNVNENDSEVSDVDFEEVKSN